MSHGRGYHIARYDLGAYNAKGAKDMSQHYSKPERASDPHALPDVEVFHVSAQDFADAGPDTWHAERLTTLEYRPTACEELAGWYWQACFPGCLPDGEPQGPYATEAEAIAAVQEGSED